MSLNRHTVAEVLTLCESLGCTVEEQKSFWKVSSPDSDKKALYIGKAKRYMTRFDVSGFVPGEHPSISPVSEEEAKNLKLGAVRGQILPKNLPEGADVLEGVRVAVASLQAEGEGFKLSVRQPKEETAEVAETTEFFATNLDDVEPEEVTAAA